MDQNNLPNKSTSYWHDSVDVPHFPKLNEKIQVDVGIVGGGMTGITAAYLLSQQGFKVCVVDAGVLLNGTTGHTTAKITAQHGLIYDELIKHFGEDGAKLYYEANHEAQKFIEQTIKKHNISCHLTEDDAYIYTNSKDDITKLENEHKAYEKLNIEGSISDDCELPFPVKKVLKMTNQAYFHPLMYLKDLIKICQENGVKFYEQTRALTIEYNKGPTIITEDDHRIICRYVIQASHYPFYDGQGFYPVKMYAARSYIIAAKTKKKIKGGMYINAETPTRSIRPITINNEDLLLIGGDGHKTGQSNEPMMNHYESLYQFTDKHFHVESVLYRWSAQDLVTLDKVPYIGRVTKAQHNVFVATGYRKWGMTNSTNAAKLLTDLIMDKENSYEEFFSPGRNIKADPAIRKFVSYNSDVAKHLIKGKLERTHVEIENLQSNEACISTVNGQRAGVYKDNEGVVHAVDTTCTHLGCEVEWNNAENSWDCPCHGSRYTYTGDILNGPAVKPLKKIDLGL
ncbi:FAD-dependent oxidoreductase [Pseudogracilibacillus sp. SE30717A]|uniref:FAD-dependent oxidoreductase n=1 Tax=Pseudogracilibacillus sp. SE30717A TaxID=3098293 RepID=UPI00300E186A